MRAAWTGSTPRRAAREHVTAESEICSHQPRFVFDRCLSVQTVTPVGGCQRGVAKSELPSPKEVEVGVHASPPG
jgi:hypothetical protein